MFDRVCKNCKLNLDKLKLNIRLNLKNVIPYILKKWGITEQQLCKLAEKSFTKRQMDNNIVDLSEKDVCNILKSVY